MILLAVGALLLFAQKSIRSLLSGFTGIGLNSPFSKGDDADRIYTQAMKRGLGSYMSRMVVAWAKFESGNFSHSFYRDDKNGFGYMRDPNSKYQIGGGRNADNGKPIGQYRSIEDSVNEVVDWMNRRYSRQDRGKWPKPSAIASPEQFVGLIKAAGYFGGAHSVYLAGVKKYLGI